MISSWCLTNYLIPDKQSTAGRDQSLKRQLGTRLGFHLSDDGGPNGPLRLRLGLGGFLRLFCPPITFRSS